MISGRSPDLLAIDACFVNAEELLRAASLLLEQGGAPRLAYHLALLALEEIGKSRILGMRVVSDRHGQEMPGFIDRALDDHVRKLFWAIWGPSMGEEIITVQQIQENLGLAMRLHEKRIAGLYVDRLEGGEVALPTGVITSEETTALLTFVNAGLEIARVRLVDDGADPAVSDAHERQKEVGYHRQARVENAFFRYKSIIGGSLRARSPSGRVTEAVIACNVLNQMTEVGRPASYSISR